MSAQSGSGRPEAAVAASVLPGGGIASIVFGLHANRRASEAIHANADKDRALVHSDGLRLLARSEVERPRDPVLGLLLAVEGGGAAAGRERCCTITPLMAGHVRLQGDGGPSMAKLRAGCPARATGRGPVNDHAYVSATPS